MPNVFNLSDVFISYSRKDTDFVKHLDAAFKAQDMEVWVDWEDIPLSANWMQEIEAGIEGADVFIFVISPDSIASEICMKELNHAVMHNKRFIPILHRDADNISGQAQSIISAHNWVFFRDSDDFDTAFSNLLQTIKADFNHLRQHTRLMVRANEWESNNWRNDFLLTGIELENGRKWLEDALSGEKQPAPTDSHKLYIETSRTAAINNQRRVFGTISALIIFSILSVALFFMWNSASIARDKAEEQEAIAVALAEENAAITRSMQLALHAETIAHDGDSYSALPFAIAAYDEASTSYAEVALSNIALSPSPMAWLLEHSEGIRYVDTHPSELIAVTASRDNTLIVWDLSVHPPVMLHRLYDEEAGHHNDVRAAVFSPDGSLIVSGGNDGGVILWNTESGEIEAILSPTDYREELNTDQVAFSPDGHYVLVSFENLGSNGATPDDDRHELRIIDIETGEVVQIVGGEGYSAGTLTFSPDGSQFLAGLTSGEIWIWDFEPDAEIYNDLVGTFTALPDDEDSGDTEESESAEDEEAFEFPVAVARLQEHRAGELILDMGFNEDGTLLFTAGEDYDIIIWDWQTQEMVRVLDGHTDNVVAAAFIPGTNQLLSTSRDRNIIVWNLDNGEIIRMMTGHESLPEALAVTYDGNRAVTGSLSSALAIVWDLEVVDFSNDFDSGTDEIRRVAYHPDGVWVATLSLDLAPLDDDPTLNLWNPQTGELVQTFENHPWGGYDLGFVLDNYTIVSVTGTRLAFSDIETGETTPADRLYDGNGTLLWDIDVHPDGRQIVGATQGGDLLLWTIVDDSLEETDDVTLQIFEDISNGIRLLTVEYNPDNPTQVFVTSNTRVFTFDLTTGEIVGNFVGHTESAVGMAVNAERQILVTTDFRRDVFVWNYETHELLNVLTFHTGVVWGVDIDPTGRFVATSAENGEVLLWDLEINVLVRRFSGYGQRIRSVAFSPDGQYLIFGEQELHHIRLYSSDDLLTWINNYRVMDTVTCAEQRRLIVNPECASPAPETIELNTPMSGSVHMESEDVWIYEGQADETITITVTAENPPPYGLGGSSDEVRRAGGYLDTIVEIFYLPDDSEAETPLTLLAENDDAPGNSTYNSLIANLTLPQDGEYRIVMTSYNGDSSGDYTILIEPGNPTESE